MKLHLNSLIVSMLLAASAAQAAPASMALLAARATDQVPARLQATAPARMSTATLDHTPATMSWAVDPAAPLDARPTPFVQSSREYWVDASADQLQRGLRLTTSADGAVIRLSPHAGNRGTIDPATLSFRVDGKLVTSTDAIRSVADEDALRAAGMAVPQGSIVFKMADGVGHGAFELIAAGASGAYLVHVFEPSSQIVLSLRANRDTIIAGETLELRAAIEGGARLDRLSGLLSAPDGHVQDVRFERRADGSFAARVQPDPAHAGGFGLWEIHAFGNALSGGLDVARDARDAFAVSVATARLDGAIERIPSAGKDTGVQLRIGIESAVASRYQLAGVLYGTRADGRLAPVAMAHSASWIAAGNGTIDLRFEAGAVQQAGVGAPYELRDLRLINQADMSLLERRERAAILR
ncbi:MAG: DUF4785 family protein [Dokdonella sp.]|nr:DUF4785 family protein [Dokdonella sp.]MCB1572910.1 DUF4785 family protein [Xanthomonadales bacterium]MCB1577035.1 DUF4785 family protein [Xanthomonadales bacterium]